VQLV
jgi:hypothetical protein